MYKTGILTVLGAAGGAIASLLGGWDYGIQTLLLFMLADYITGLVVAAFFHRSPNAETGALSSNAGLRGIGKKLAMLVLVLVSVRLDPVLGTDYLRDAVVIALTLNELLSIVENVGLTGFPIPDVIQQAIDLLRKKGV